MKDDIQNTPLLITYEENFVIRDYFDKLKVPEAIREQFLKVNKIEKHINKYRKMGEETYYSEETIEFGWKLVRWYMLCSSQNWLPYFVFIFGWTNSIRSCSPSLSNTITYDPDFVAQAEIISK
jgi:hypothetical protein